MAKYTIGDDTSGGGGGGDANILQLQDNNRIRLIDLTDAREWKQHRIPFVGDEDKTPLFAVCPGPKACPACQKNADEKGNQRFSISKRFVTNVWDYASESVKVLIGGPQIFNEFRDAKKVGIDPLLSDWIITKSGAKMKTSYKLARADASPFTATTADALRQGSHDLDKYDSPASSEKIFELIEQAGWNYDTLMGPHFTLDEALAFVVPFGKCKNQTVEQILLSDEDYAKWFHETKLNDGEITHPIFVAFHTAMEARGMVDSLESVPAASHAPQATQAAAPAPSAPEPTTEAFVALLSPTGEEQQVPANAVDALLAAGFTHKPEPVPEPEPEAVEVTGGPKMLKNPADGSVQEYGEELVGPLLMAGFELIQEAPAPDADFAPPAPAIEPIPDTEIVHAVIGGSHVPMPFSAAKTAQENGNPLDFEDARVTAYLAHLAANPAQTAEEAQLHQDNSHDPQPETLPTADADKPFVCEYGCGKSYKKQGPLTQHYNAVHGGPPAVETPADPVPAAPPAVPEPTPAPVQAAPAPTPAPAPVQQNGNGEAPATEDHAEVLARVKKVLQDNPTNDYQKLLNLLEEIAGERDITKFNVEQLLKLEAAIQAGSAN